MKGNKILLPIALVKPGMITADVIFNKSGNVLIWENVLLNENTILHLKNLQIQFVPVYKDHKDPRYGTDHNFARDSIAEFTANYSKNVDLTKNIFLGISSGGGFDAETADEVIESIVEETQENRHIIEAVTQVKNISDYTYCHSMNVSMLCMMIARWLRFDDINLRNVVQAGLLHDVGKAIVPINILNKPDKLTDIEFTEIKRHSEYGYNLVSRMNGVSEEVATAVLTHHEKEDGSGYPFGLKGDEINIYSKIITIADIFDAMTSNRTYKGKDTPLEVFGLMQHNSFGVLNTVILKTFLENVSNFCVGAKVCLNTGEYAEIVFMNRMDLAHPIIMINGQYIDTSINREVIVEEFV